MHTAISIKVVPEQSGKVEYERIAKKLMNFLKLSRSYEFFSDSQQAFALVFDFSALLGDNIEIAACIYINFFCLLTN